MMLKIHKLVQAEDDLAEIWRYSFETWGEAQADRYYDALVQGIDLLAKNPDIGTTCDDIREGYRRFKIERHVIFYKITSEILTIVRVLHERMDIEQYIEE
ncbi:type II toxin-antitoxin system RelE/ParE family toxin [Nitrosomonas communis]|uniref:type II toxin-antitoxin system RelE/ParE family toxin n=1 Tax=Nitrosomonas communis TaxID=44574 RepID=UPI003D29559E